jgi:hypothetical protein
MEKLFPRTRIPWHFAYEATGQHTSGVAALLRAGSARGPEALCTPELRRMYARHFIKALFKRYASLTPAFSN